MVALAELHKENRHNALSSVSTVAAERVKLACSPPKELLFVSARTCRMQNTRFTDGQLLSVVENLHLETTAAVINERLRKVVDAEKTIH